MSSFPRWRRLIASIKREIRSFSCFAFTLPAKDQQTSLVYISQNSKKHVVWRGHKSTDKSESGHGHSLSRVLDIFCWPSLAIFLFSSLLTFSISLPPNLTSPRACWCLTAAKIRGICDVKLTLFHPENFFRPSVRLVISCWIVECLHKSNETNGDFKKLLLDLFCWKKKWNMKRTLCRRNKFSEFTILSSSFLSFFTWKAFYICSVRWKLCWREKTSWWCRS